jgi:hypothetical protein
MWNKLKKWLFPDVEEFKYNALDRDGDGKVQEGSPFERKVEVVKKTTKKAAAPKKKAPVKKTTAKKTAPVKKTAPKKTTKKK